MKAMIFAAGLGTRLKPLTDTMPKALVPIAGKPLLQHVLEKLIQAGFDEVIINVHHFAQQIIDFVHVHNDFGIRIAFSDETNALLETGGGIKKASSFFSDGQPFLVHNVDILSNINLAHVYQEHLRSKAVATLVVSSRQTSRYLLFDEHRDLKGWVNTTSGETKSPLANFSAEGFTHLAFAGIHVFTPELFSYFSNFGERFSIIDFYLSVCANEHIKAYIPNDLKMIDVGKLNVLDDAECFVLNL